MVLMVPGLRYLPLEVEFNPKRTSGARIFSPTRNLEFSLLTKLKTLHDVKQDD